MKLLQFILNTITTVFFTSADPNLFGSRKRRKGKEDLAAKFESRAADTQGEIDILKTKNPFEGAAAKSAMATSKRNATQIQQRYANMLGGNASAESLVAAQGATQEAVAGTAGDIAVGSEANKAAQLAQLRGEKMGMQSQAGAIEQSSIEERGSGWSTLFQGLDALGGIAEGVGSVI